MVPAVRSRKEATPMMRFLVCTSGGGQSPTGNEGKRKMTQWKKGKKQKARSNNRIIGRKAENVRTFFLFVLFHPSSSLGMFILQVRCLLLEISWDELEF